jgi:hypothetical protein
MLRNGLPKLPRGSEDALDDCLLPFAYEELDQCFLALLEDEELEEAFGEFRVDAARPG